MKYLDAKIRGSAKFDPPKASPRKSRPEHLCYRGLTKMAEIALNVRTKRDLSMTDNKRASISTTSVVNQSARRLKVNNVSAYDLPRGSSMVSIEENTAPEVHLKLDNIAVDRNIKISEEGGQPTEKSTRRRMGRKGYQAVSLLDAH